MLWGPTQEASPVPLLTCPCIPQAVGVAEGLGEEAGCCLPGDAVAEYEAALGHHAQHGELAADDRGRAMAAGNAGLLLARLGRGEEAVEMHKVRGGGGGGA